jgi:hypothetical protein
MLGTQGMLGNAANKFKVVRGPGAGCVRPVDERAARVGAPLFSCLHLWLFQDQCVCAPAHNTAPSRPAAPPLL